MHLCRSILSLMWHEGFVPWKIPHASFMISIKDSFMLQLQIICTAFDMLFIIDSASETQLCPNNDSTKHEQS